MSNAADKYKSVSAVTFHVSIFSEMSLGTFSRAVYVEWKTLDMWLQYWTFKQLDTIFSNTLKMKDLLEKGL